MSRYNYDNLRGNIEKELKNETMPENLYKSVDSVSRILMSIIDTGGEGWAAQALNGEDLKRILDRSANRSEA